MVVISRNVDLSVGSVVGLSAYLSASLFADHPGIPIPVVFLAGLGIGLACGIANGIMVAVGRVPSLVVTLATLYIIRGIDILIVGGNEVDASSLPDAFINITKDTIVGIPDIAIAVAVVIGIGAYYLRTYRSGRDLYAIGSNPDAARLAGLPVGRRVFTAFAVSGAIAGIAGVLWAAQYPTINSTAGTGYELQVVSAVVVGGVAIFGGSGTATGAALGALLLTTINSALYVLGISSFWDQAIWGFLLLVAIALDQTITERLTSALRSRKPGSRRRREPGLGESGLAKTWHHQLTEQHRDQQCITSANVCAPHCAGRPASRSSSSVSSSSARPPRRSSSPGTTCSTWACPTARSRS